MNKTAIWSGLPIKLSCALLEFCFWLLVFLSGKFVALAVDKISALRLMHVGELTLYVFAVHCKAHIPFKVHVFILLFCCSASFSFQSVWKSSKMEIHTDRVGNEKHNWWPLTLANGLYHIFWFRMLDNRKY